MPGTEKTQHISLTTQVENRLKHQLSIGALKPGARLITKNIAQELRSSRRKSPLCPNSGVPLLRRKLL